MVVNDISLNSDVIKYLNDIEEKLLKLDIAFKGFPSIDQELVILFIKNFKMWLFKYIYQSEVSVTSLYIYLSQILSNIVTNYQEKVESFFSKVIELKQILITDLNAFIKKDPAATCIEEVVVSYNSFNAIYIYRLAHLLKQLEIKVLPRMMTEYAHSMTGIDIHPNAVIGHSFFIDHGTGVVIGETTIIGNNVSIYQGVTLGAISTRNAESLKNSKRHPTILNNVTIYANATILGGETIIENDVTIGASCFITKSVKEHSIITFMHNKI